MEPRTVRDIAAVLSPEGDGDGEPADLVEQPVVVPELTLAEMTAVVGRFRSHGKAPGQDGIPQGSVLGPLLWNVAYETPCFAYRYLAGRSSRGTRTTR